MNIVDYFIKLYKEKSQLALLTWAYLAITVVFVILAGIFALFNQAFGLSVLIVPFVAIIALCVNVTAWALIRYLLDGIISRREIAKKLLRWLPLMPLPLKLPKMLLLSQRPKKQTWRKPNLLKPIPKSVLKKLPKNPKPSLALLKKLNLPPNPKNNC